LGRLFARDALARRAALKRVAARVPGRPWLYFAYSYFLRLGFLDGRKGLEFCRLKAGYQRMVATKKFDLRMQRKQRHHKDDQ